MVIFGSFFTNLKESSTGAWQLATGAVANIGSSLILNCQIKCMVSKLQMDTLNNH
jgi:hypothetical protein